MSEAKTPVTVIGPVSAELAGRVVVNLSSDMPENTREAADGVAERDADFLAGGVMVPEPMVGKDGADVFRSGPKAVFAGQSGHLPDVAVRASARDGPTWLGRRRREGLRTLGGRHRRQRLRLPARGRGSDRTTGRSRRGAARTAGPH